MFRNIWVRAIISMVIFCAVLAGVVVYGHHDISKNKKNWGPPQAAMVVKLGRVQKSHSPLFPAHYRHVTVRVWRLDGMAQDWTLDAKKDTVLYQGARAWIDRSGNNAVIDIERWNDRGSPPWDGMSDYITWGLILAVLATAGFVIATRKKKPVGNPPGASQDLPEDPESDPQDLRFRPAT